MRKLNTTLLNGSNKEEAILKIKDDSFTITTDNQLVKVPYSNIKGYDYNKQKEILTIAKYGGNPIKLNIIRDEKFLELLDDVVKQNSDSNSEDNKSNSEVKKEEKKITEEKKEETKVLSSNNNKSPGTIGIIVFMVIGVIITILVCYLTDNDNKPISLEDKYFNAPIERCPSKTLKEGLTDFNLISLDQHSILDEVKIESGKNKSGEETDFIYWGNYSVSISLDSKGQVVLGGQDSGLYFLDISTNRASNLKVDYFVRAMCE